jgi:hypothetical protein
MTKTMACFALVACLSVWAYAQAPRDTKIQAQNFAEKVVNGATEAVKANRAAETPIYQPMTEEACKVFEQIDESGLYKVMCFTILDEENEKYHFLCFKAPVTDGEQGQNELIEVEVDEKGRVKSHKSCEFDIDIAREKQKERK